MIVETVTTIGINVLPVNDAPDVVDDTYATVEDELLNVAAPGVLSNDVDVDEDLLTITVVNEPSNGSLMPNADGSFTYTPEPNFNGTDSFVYRAEDGNGGSDTADVIIIVSSVNDPPQAENDSYVTEEDGPLAIAAPGCSFKRR